MFSLIQISITKYFRTPPSLFLCSKRQLHSPLVQKVLKKNKKATNAASEKVLIKYAEVFENHSPVDRLIPVKDIGLAHYSLGSSDSDKLIKKLLLSDFCIPMYDVIFQGSPYLVKNSLSPLLEVFGIKSVGEYDMQERRHALNRWGELVTDLNLKSLKTIYQEFESIGWSSRNSYKKRLIGAYLVQGTNRLGVDGYGLFKSMLSSRKPNSRQPNRSLKPLSEVIRRPFTQFEEEAIIRACLVEGSNVSDVLKEIAIKSNRSSTSVWNKWTRQIKPTILSHEEGTLHRNWKAGLIKFLLISMHNPKSLNYGAISFGDLSIHELALNFKGLTKQVIHSLFLTLEKEHVNINETLEKFLERKLEIYRNQQTKPTHSEKIYTLVGIYKTVIDELKKEGVPIKKMSEIM